MKLLLLFVICLTAYGQSFDRLMLRPRADGTSDYDPGVIQFYDSRWPATGPDVQYTGLQALDHERLMRYTLTLPPAAATEDSCFLVNPDGVMSYTPLDAAGACRQGRYRLLGKYVGLASQEDTTDCSDCFAWEYERRIQALTGIDPAWMESWSAAESSAFGAWMFPVPGGLSDPPVFWAYVHSSSGIGTNELSFHVGCVTPATLLEAGDTQGILTFGALGSTSAPFDSPNEFVLTPGAAGRLHRIEVPLVFHADWHVGDLCLLAVKRTTPAGDFNLTSFLEVGLE